MTIMVVGVSSVPASSAVLEVGVSCLEAAVHLQLGEKIVRASRGREIQPGRGNLDMGLLL